MKKRITQVILFVLFVSLGLLLIESTLQGSAWWCRCADGYEAQQDCMELCSQGHHGDCLFVAVYWSSCVCMGGNNACNCKWYVECEDRARGFLFTEFEGCIDCE